MMQRLACATMVSLGLALVSVACREGARSPPNDRSTSARIDTTRTSASSRPPGDRVRNGARDTALAPGSLTTMATAPVTPWTGPGGRPFEVTLRTADPVSALARRFGTITLRTSLRARAPDLGQYPCTSCHLGRRMALADERVADAHQNIKPVHPAQTGAVCSTCHAADNVEFLALKSGDRVTLDHAYRLCAQCHFSQAEAWAGGAHGKRLDGWQGRRVVMGCADCHDPHKPALEPRIPFRAPQIERIRGHDQ